MEIFKLCKKWCFLPLLVIGIIAFFSSLEANAQLPRKQLPPRGSSGSGELPPLNRSSSSSQSSHPLINTLSEHSDDIARAGAQALTEVFDKHVYEWGEDYKRFDISASYDSHIEGPALGIQYRTPFMFGLFARAGYNTHYDEYQQNLKKLRWTAGIQLWIKNLKIMEVGVGESYYKEPGDTSYGLSMQMGWCQKIYRGLGIDGSLGVALSFKSDSNGNPYAKFIWRAGLVYRFCFN